VFDGCQVRERGMRKHHRLKGGTMYYHRAALTILLACVTAACDTRPDADGAAVDADAQPTAAADPAHQAYTAQLAPVNASLLGSTPAGEARLEIRGDSLSITIDVRGVPPGMAHLQHFHGFEDGSAARCPGPDADQNGDGIVDVTETASMAGTTMVPFHVEPKNLEIAAETYPRADQQGSYSYRQTVALEELRLAFRQKFGGDLDLDRRVVFIHGVPEDMELPATAHTKAGLPAHATLPIACGELRAVGAGNAGS
jgi:hypothetical protein